MKFLVNLFNSVWGETCVSMDRERRAPYELSGCALCPVLLAATCLSVCLPVCPHATNRARLPRFIVKFCTRSLLTHPKFVLKWATVLLLLKCANFDIGQQQRTYCCVRPVPHWRCSGSPEPSQIFLRTTAVWGTKVVRGQWQARSYAIRISVRHDGFRNNYFSKVQRSLYLPPGLTWEIPHSAHTVYLCVLCGLTDWFL